MPNATTDRTTMTSFVDLAVDLALALDCTVTSVDAGDATVAALLTDSADRTFRVRRDEDAGPLAVTGCYPAHAAVRLRNSPCINVARGAGIDAAARDIKSRFLPAFHRAHARELDRIAAWDANEAALDESAAALARTIPGATVSTGVATRTVHTPECVFHLEHDRTSLVVRAAPSGLADTVAGFIAARRVVPWPPTCRR